MSWYISSTNTSFFGLYAYRLWQVDILDRVSACACLCAHVSKLSVLLSPEMGVTQYAPAFTRIVSIFLIAIAITNGLLFETKINSTKVSKTISFRT